MRRESERKKNVCFKVRWKYFLLFLNRLRERDCLNDASVYVRERERERERENHQI